MNNNGIKQQGKGKERSPSALCRSSPGLTIHNVSCSARAQATCPVSVLRLGEHRSDSQLLGTSICDGESEIGERGIVDNSCSTRPGPRSRPAAHESPAETCPQPGPGDWLARPVGSSIRSTVPVDRSALAPSSSQCPGLRTGSQRESPLLLPHHGPRWHDSSSLHKMDLILEAHDCEPRIQRLPQPSQVSHRFASLQDSIFVSGNVRNSFSSRYVPVSAFALSDCVSTTVPLGFTVTDSECGVLFVRTALAMPW
ncbi:hypothetical protein UY3_09593 [Chelonia mydas]|uniref:Uncharacterized protein n=1 Tax=Chelonia mydas TaxID=8469 RepID=M7BMM2_CHEMY|nr:hypothetical protein UY3_09593 [Chelonia mydas]